MCMIVAVVKSIISRVFHIVVLVFPTFGYQRSFASHVTHATGGWFLCRERPVAKILPIYVISINVCAVDVV